MIKAVLFDMDGLLVDTERLGIRVAVHVCKNLGINLDLEEQHSFIGVTDEKFYRELFKKRGLNHDALSVLKKHFEIYEKLLTTELKAFTSAHTLPKNLKANGYKLALVSGSTKNQIDIVLKQLKINNYFDVVVSCDEVKKSKPDPEGYLAAAKKLRAEPNECLVFEDTRTGILAAKNAGMKAVGVINAGGQDLSSACFVIENLSAAETKNLWG